MPTDLLQPPGMFSALSKPYTGLYPGADPYSTPMLLKEGIPSAQQESLQKPLADPIPMATLLSVPGIPGVAGDMSQETLKPIMSGIFSYLTRALLRAALDKVNSPSGEGKSNARQPR